MKKPIYNFNDETSIGVDLVPDNSFIHIESFNGSPMTIVILPGNALTGASTVQNLIDQPLWWSSIGAERGGIAWDTGTEYVAGDIVTDSGQSWLATAPVAGASPGTTLGQWSNTGEVGGLLYNSDSLYSVGDLVTHGGITYECKTAITIPEAWDDTKWTSKEEKAGRAYNSGVTYLIGDVVVEAGVLYTCNTDITIPEGFVPAKWDKGNERGGLIHDVTVDYFVGDIVTEDNSLTPLVPAKVYRCITDTTAGAMVPIEWAQVSEQGGTVWDTGTYYHKGDVVTDTLVAPAKVYIAIADNNNIDPKSSPGNWQSLDSVWYNATTGGDRNGDGTLDLSDGAVAGDGGGMHCPWAIGTGAPLSPVWNSGTSYAAGTDVNYTGWKYTSIATTTIGSTPDATPAEWRLSGPDGNPSGTGVGPNTLGEYPNTQVNGAGTEKIGASWVISGLGFDKDGIKNRYIMTGGDLNLLAIKDGDQITWVDGAHGSEIWFLSPAPEVVGERGGLLWSSGKVYIIGDVVGGSDGKQYTAIWQSAGMDPVNQAANNWAWSCTTEGGGLIFDEYKTYPKLAIISIPDVYPSGLTMTEQFLSVLDNNKGNDPLTDNGTNWERYTAVKYIDEDITFTVTGNWFNPGDFPDLQTCLDFLGRFVPVDGAIINVVINSGHEINYPVNIKGVNLEYVTITSSDAKVICDVNGITEPPFTFTSCTTPTFEFNFLFTGANANNNLFAITRSKATFTDVEITFDTSCDLSGTNVHLMNILDQSTVSAMEIDVDCTNVSITNGDSMFRLNSNSVLNVFRCVINADYEFDYILFSGASSISALFSDMKEDSVNAAYVESGGIIRLNNSTGQTDSNIVKNSTESQGIIFF